MSSFQFQWTDKLTSLARGKGDKWYKEWIRSTPRCRRTYVLAFLSLFFSPSVFFCGWMLPNKPRNRWISSAGFMLAASLIRNHPSSWLKGKLWGNPPKSHSVTLSPGSPKKKHGFLKSTEKGVIRRWKINAISWLVSPGRVSFEGGPKSLSLGQRTWGYSAFSHLFPFFLLNKM